MQVVRFAYGLPAIGDNCRDHVANAFNSTLKWDWLRCGRHLIYNVVKIGLDFLKDHSQSNTTYGVCIASGTGQIAGVFFSQYCSMNPQPIV